MNSPGESITVSFIRYGLVTNSYNEKGRNRPITEQEEKHIVYFLQNSEAGLRAAAKRFKRDETTIKRVMEKYGLKTWRYDETS